MTFSKIMSTLSRRTIALIPAPVRIYAVVVAAVATVVVVAAVWVTHAVKADVDTAQTTVLSPNKVWSVEGIGQWEFLTIHDEQLIDTLRRGIFSDDHLARIYYGTLRLGIDLQKAPTAWIKTTGDSISATLPPIKLLDDEFIDEALTRTFYEDGKWDAKTYKRMYQRAAAEMARRAMDTANLASARRNAQTQFYTLFRSMGFKRIGIRFEDEKKSR